MLQDLGQALGRHVFILNCNEGMNQHRTGKVLLGASQTGAVVLYDNVNCLQPDVMSVFASQIAPILQVLWFIGPSSHGAAKVKCASMHANAALCIRLPQGPSA